MLNHRKDIEGLVKTLSSDRQTDRQTDKPRDCSLKAVWLSVGKLDYLVKVRQQVVVMVTVTWLSEVCPSIVSPSNTLGKSCQFSVVIGCFKR